VKRISGSRIAQSLIRVSVFLIMLALIAGMVSCGVQSYALVITSAAGGNVTTPGEGIFSYEAGTVVNLMAEAEEGYRFVSWTGNVSTIADVNAAATNITMNGDYSITANFVKQYNLTTSSIEGGSVTKPGEGMFTYDAGTVVDLLAIPDDGYYFANWTGDVGMIANVYAAAITVTMNGDYFITANFEVSLWDSTITLDCHLTVPNENTSLAKYIYLPWIAELEAINGTLGGKFDVNVTYGDIPYDRYSSLSAISAGVVDMGQLSPETYHLGGLGYMPWMFPNITGNAYTMYNIVTEGNGTWDKLNELGHVKILLATPLWGAQYWGRDTNVTVPADLTDVKVGCEAGEAPTILALGGMPVYIPISDLADALSLAVIDGCFFTYSGIESAFGLGGATDYTTELNMFYRPYALAMNRDSYDNLPAEARTALDSVCGASASATWALAHLAGEAGDRNTTSNDRPIYVPTPDELNLWKAATASVDDGWAGYVTALGFNGTGILARAIELIALSP